MHKLLKAYVIIFFVNNMRNSDIIKVLFSCFCESFFPVKIMNQKGCIFVEST